jgi:hypothetical protein
MAGPRYNGAMYRDDRDALVQRVDALEKTEQLNDQMKRELIDLRRTAAMSPAGDPYENAGVLGPAERVALGEHQLEKFPVWAALLLHLSTFGLFSLIYYGLQHGRFPKVKDNDPSPGMAIGFAFIPFFNYYWVFFNPLRLCDRITLQYRLRGSSDSAPRGMQLATSILSVIPYINMLTLLLVWPIQVCLLQSSINRLVDLGPVQLEAHPPQPLLASSQP